jgi:hypothetical protein
MLDLPPTRGSRCNCSQTTQVARFLTRGAEAAVVGTPRQAVGQRACVARAVCSAQSRFGTRCHNSRPVRWRALAIVRCVRGLACLTLQLPTCTLWWLREWCCLITSGWRRSLATFASQGPFAFGFREDGHTKGRSTDLHACMCLPHLGRVNARRRSCGRQ